MKHLMKDYGKYILAILGVVLMMTFTLPSFMKNMQDTGNREVGRLNGKKVTAAEAAQASREMQVLAKFQVLPQVLGLVREENDIDRGTHWLLLLREASEAGIVASDAEIRQAVAAAQIPEAEFQSLLTDSGLSQQDLRSCVAQGLMILKEASLAALGAQTPVPEVEYLANEELSTIRMQYAVIDGARDWKKQPRSGADQIKKQFELYKNIVATPIGSDALPPVIDEHTYPFGYKYPDRVKVEFLKFDRTAILSRFQATREDYQEAYKYYSAHLSEFHKDSSTNSMTLGTQQPFEDVRDKLVKDQVSARVDKFIKRLTDRVLETAKQPWNSAKPDENGYRETVARDKWVDYKALAAGLAQGKEFDGYSPEYVQAGAWQGHENLGKLEGIGESFYETPNAHYPFADVAMHIRELDLPKDTFPRLFLQVGIEGPVLQDALGNRYIFRITDAEKSHTPASLDEVRGTVIEDLQKATAYQQSQSQAKALADSAATDDLSTLAKKQNFDTRTVPELTHLGEDYPDVRGIPGLVNAAFDLAREESKAQSAATQAAATQSAIAHKAIPLNVDSRLQIYVIALDAFNPVTPAAFAANRDKYMRAAQESYERLMIYGWTSLDAVAKRMNYVPTTPFATTKTAA